MQHDWMHVSGYNYPVAAIMIVGNGEDDEIRVELQSAFATGPGTIDLWGMSGDDIIQISSTDASGNAIPYGNAIALYGGAGNDTLLSAREESMNLYGGDGDDIYQIRVDNNGDAVGVHDFSGISEVRVEGTSGYFFGCHIIVYQRELLL